MYDLWSTKNEIRLLCVFIIGLFLSCGLEQTVEMPDDRTPGMVGDAYYLPNGWRLTPAGTHFEINDLPTNIALSPDGNYAAVLSTGWHAHTITVFDLDSKTLVDSAIVNRAWLGLSFNEKGDRLYASGGNQDKIHEFIFNDGKLEESQGFSARGLDIEQGGNLFYWSGITIDPDGKYLYAADCNNSNLAVFDLQSHELVDTVNVEVYPIWKYTRLPTPTKQYPYGFKREQTASPSQPYELLFNPAGNELYISNWAERSVSVLGIENKVIARTIPVGDHPNDMVLSSDGRLFVANASSNSVSVIDTRTLKVLESINTTLYPLAPEGSTPNAIALDEESMRLYVANADNNCLCVVDISEKSESRVLGFIPTGWYPSSLEIDTQRNLILVGNGKGLASAANPEFAGPQRIPEDQRKPGSGDYIGRILKGALSFIPIPASGELKKYTKQVYENCPYNDDKLTEAPSDRKTVIPTKVGAPSPVKYVIYIIKENRTYDQVFGDLPQGNGDPEICLFPREVTPNHHKLAETFVLFDNYYCDGEVSRDGWSWSTAAYATDYTEKTWQAGYGRKGSLNDPTRQLTTPPSLYIWDQCARFGVSYTSYGIYRFSPAIIGHSVNLVNRPEFNSEEERKAHNYIDRGKVDNWIIQFDKYAAGDSLPQFQVLGLGNDHNFGTAPGRPTPRACMSDNDHAVGKLVEHVSKSKYWKEMAVFIIQDDAQNGPDHIDCHRTVAMVASPYARREYVDHTFYTTSSMLRTMELILGLPPMSQFDAAATPMFNAFTDEAVMGTYTCLPPGPDIDKINKPNMFGAERSEEFNLLGIDEAPDIERSEITWKAIKGEDSEMPPPVRRAFTFKEHVTLAVEDRD